jgi:hypothetical protein
MRNANHYSQAIHFLYDRHAERRQAAAHFVYAPAIAELVAAIVCQLNSADSQAEELACE